MITKLKLTQTDATRCLFPDKGEIRKSYQYMKVYLFTLQKVIHPQQRFEFEKR
jgi:hypothetical protein